MTATTPVARDEMFAVVKAALAPFNGVVVQWPGVDTLEPPSADTDWVRITLEHDSGSQASLAGADGARRWNRGGTIFAQCFGRLAVGSDVRANELACAVRDAFQGRATVSGVWFRNCGIREVGRDKFWYQTNAFITFDYDEVQ
jgi:hypothetical protein